MSKNLQMCLPHLSRVANVTDSTKRKQLLKDMCDQRCFQKALREIAVNTINKKVPLTDVQKKALRKSPEVIAQLGRKIKKKSTKKDLIIQSGGILPYLIPAVTTLIGKLIADGIIRKSGGGRGHSSKSKILTKTKKRAQIR